MLNVPCSVRANSLESSQEPESEARTRSNDLLDLPETEAVTEGVTLRFFLEVSLILNSAFLELALKSL